MEAAAEAARKYRERMKLQGFAPLNTWVPREWREEILEMVRIEVERRLALRVKDDMKGGRKGA